MDLLHHPHHDGSGLYVDAAEPKPGEVVTVRVRVPADLPVVAVHVRTAPDGEPRFTEAVPVTGPTTGYGDTDSWYAATVVAHQPVTRYRFLLRLADGTPLWLTAAGTADHDVPDATDFRLVSYEAPPAWAADAIVYEIFPDRFARSLGAPVRPVPEWAIPCDWDTTEVIGRGPETPVQYYGGDLDGIIEHLDHIRALGADTVYLTPFFPAPSNHRYNATDFDTVDPLLGGDEALRRLAGALHARGMRLIGDITPNHCGQTHPWFTAAAARPDSVERTMFHFRPDGGYEAWCGVPSLPKLDWRSHATRTRVAAVVRRWLGPLDGWRVDVANMTGRLGAQDVAHDAARVIRAAATEASPQALVVAEHAHDATGDLDTDGWHGTMNYAGFLRPVWAWLRDPAGPDERIGDFLGVPGGIYRRDGDRALATMRTFAGRISWRSLIASWQLLGSHDTPRIRSVVGSREAQVVAIGLLATLPGVPMVFAGDEFGLTGENGEASRTPMPWRRPAERDEGIHAAYRDLLGLRRAEPALRRGGLRWAHADADTLVFIREYAGSSVLVAARRAAGPAIGLPGVGDGTPLHGGVPLVSGEVPASDGPVVQVWRLG